MDLDEQPQNFLSDKWGPQVLIIVNEELSLLLKAMPTIRGAFTTCIVDGIEAQCSPLRILCYYYGFLVSMGPISDAKIKQVNPLLILLSPEAICKIEDALLMLANGDASKYEYDVPPGFLLELESTGARLQTARETVVERQSTPNSTFGTLHRNVSRLPTARQRP